LNKNVRQSLAVAHKTFFHCSGKQGDTLIGVDIFHPNQVEGRLHQSS